jgi:plasmid replication initiation protein
MMTSRIRNTNTDGKSFTFTFAYHTYFHVTDIRFFDNIYLLLASLGPFFCMLSSLLGFYLFCSDF